MVHIIGVSYQVPLDSGQGFQEGPNMLSLGYLNQTDMVTGLGFSKGMGKVDLRLDWLSYQAGSFTESMAYYNRTIDLMPLKNISKKWPTSIRLIMTP